MEIDPEIANELMASFEDHYELIQQSINTLIHNTDNKELINTTFRSVHTLKGNASIMQLTPLVNYIHAIEETIGALRSGHFMPTEPVCDLILSAVDRMRDLHIKYLFNKEIVSVNEKSITETFEAIAHASCATEVDDLCHKLEALITPVMKSEPGSDLQTTDAHKNSIRMDNLRKHTCYLSLEEKQDEDLALFRSLSQQVDEKNHFWHQRTDLMLFLALKTSELSDKPIDAVQLTAAIYMHDVGMVFIPESIVHKASKLNPMEVRKLQQHPVWGHKLLRRMPGWEAAADMVLDHHERIDGQGYPNRKKGDQQNEGAKLLAIIDAFYAMTNLRADRSHRRSIMRAISEVNACIDTQFDAYWVNLFNQVIRKEIKAGTFYRP